MATVTLLNQFQRTNRQPIDVFDVFANLAAFQAHLTSGPCYAGQIVAVRNATNVPDLYRVNENYSYSPIGDGVANVVTGSATPPASPDPGAVWTTIQGELFVWNGTVWAQKG